MSEWIVAGFCFLSCCPARGPAGSALAAGADGGAEGDGAACVCAGVIVRFALVYSFGLLLLVSE